MAATTTSRRSGTPRRRHTQRQPFDRRELERRGWRTTLEYAENHERDDSGELAAVVAQWRAEGERIGADGSVIAVVSVAASPAAAWRRLRVAADSSPLPTQIEEVARR